MDQLVVALDVPGPDRALELADRLEGIAGAYKIGSELFTAAGPALVETLVGRGARVFLDLKFHDIPNTVAAAVASATRLGVWMLTLHASGGVDMMRAAGAAVRETSGRLGRPAPLLVAVTVLTSLNEAHLRALDIAAALPAHVERLAGLALEAGLAGFVCSPLEVARLRGRFGPAPVLVTPGIRSAASPGTAPDDQARTASAGSAILEGATYLVVGRPITAAPDPRRAAEALAEEIAAARRT